VAAEDRRTAGTLFGIGVGPGDPELVTVRAARLIGAAQVVAYHSAGHGRSLARAAALPYLREGQIELPLIYPVTRGATNHPGGYAGAMSDFYAAAAEQIAEHLAAGLDVALLAEGDPTLFSSYMHMHKRLAPRFTTVIVPGVTSVSAAAAAAGTPMVEANESLTIFSGTMDADLLTSRLRSTDAAVILKVSRNVDGIRGALEAAGRLGDARYVQRASHPDQQVQAFADVPADQVPYMAAIVVPGPIASAPFDAVPVNAVPSVAAPSVAVLSDGVQTAEPGATRVGEVVVVGLGPAGPQWLTPEAAAELAAADHIVGYLTYVNRVPLREGQQRHASDNRVEAERAAFALDLARGGDRVAVVSSGDPGVFAMAAAVLEVADQDYPDVPVRIIPGLSAAHAVASRVGAPLGHDFAVLSLSDLLKPWPVIAARLEAVAAADLAIAIYNPASRTRIQQLRDAQEILLRHRSPDTPVVIGRAVGSDQESVRVVPLSALADSGVDMRCLLIVGSSQTRARRSVDARPIVYTPRSYPG
jgi:precorrin-2 C20-methyltransferase/precorrin-3B C17-methyltransferase